MKRDGALVTTFVNTNARDRTPISGYADLLAWSREHGATSVAETERLEKLAAEHPEQADAAFAASEDLHRVLARIFNTLADHEEPPPEDIDALNAYLVHTVPPRRIVRSETGYRLGWAAGRKDDLARPLWAVVLSATDVLTSKYRDRVVRCAGPDCDLLFVARNPGSPRKWCQVEVCGHRFHSLRHYHAKVKPYQAELKQRAEERAAWIKSEVERPKRGT